MQIVNYLELDHKRVNEVLKDDPELYRQVVCGLLGLIAGMSMFLALVLLS